MLFFHNAAFFFQKKRLNSQGFLTALDVSPLFGRSDEQTYSPAVNNCQFSLWLSHDTRSFTYSSQYVSMIIFSIPFISHCIVWIACLAHNSLFPVISQSAICFFLGWTRKLKCPERNPDSDLSNAMSQHSLQWPFNSDLSSNRQAELLRLESACFWLSVTLQGDFFYKLNS